jgi:hypothetical protein
MLTEFPKPDPEKMKNEFGGVSGKYICKEVEKIGPTFKKIDDYIKSSEFLDLMSDITGIKDLLYDPEYHGAGTHENFPGQGMDPHIDFNYHKTTGYHRRLNAIIYLNEDWSVEWGGALELHTNPWNVEDDETIQIPPSRNTCVIFETNEISWHGFKKIVDINGKTPSRKSFTIYLYTKNRPVDELADQHETVYVPRSISLNDLVGKTFESKDLKDINGSLKHRDFLLKGLYEREKRLNNLIKFLRGYKNNFQMPISGFVKQIGSVEGVYDNFFTSKYLKYNFKTLKYIKNFIFSFNIPSYIQEQELSVYLNNSLIGVFSATDGIIGGTVYVDLARDINANLEIVFKNSASPDMSGVGRDVREFSAIINQLIFE